MEEFKPLRKTKSQLSDTPIVDGQFLFATDTRELFVDVDNIRLQCISPVSGNYLPLSGGDIQGDLTVYGEPVVRENQLFTPKILRIDLGTLPNAGRKEVPHGISEIDKKQLRISGYARGNGDDNIPLPFTSIFSEESVGISLGENNILIETANDLSMYTEAYLYIEFIDYTLVSIQLSASPGATATGGGIHPVGYVTVQANVQDGYSWQGWYDNATGNQVSMDNPYTFPAYGNRSLSAGASSIDVPPPSGPTNEPTPSPTAENTAAPTPTPSPEPTPEQGPTEQPSDEP
jgi:hypothetical protein